jgi:hypothetical protein
MNKKLITYTAVTVIALIIVAWTLIRTTELGHLEGTLGLVLQIFLLILAFPLKLYVVLFMSTNDSWSLPVLGCMLLLSGIVWGIIVERASHFFVQDAPRG